MITLPHIAKDALEDALARHGLRATKQREHVFGVLLHKRDHPTADEVYARCKADMPSISLATVYNCLETLVTCSLVRAVNYEREPTRFCPNLVPHAHFRDKDSGRVYDINLPPEMLDQLREILPEGCEAETIELYFHGHAADASLSSKSN